MNLVRVIINDVINGPQGEILTNTSPFTLPLLNDVMEWFEREVNNFGVDTFTRETRLVNILPVTTVDPGIQVVITDTGYNNGSGNYATPQIPPDLLEPLFMWERKTGSTDTFVPMAEVPDGLPSVTQGDRLAMWDWREDGIWMPGATQENDIRLRYKGAHPTFATVDDVLEFRAATGPIAYKLASSYLASRSPAASEAANAEAEKRIAQIGTQNSRTKQRESNSRMSYGGQGSGGSGFYPPTN